MKNNNYADIMYRNMKQLIIALLLFTCVSSMIAEDNKLFIKDLNLKVYISLEKEQYRIGENIYLYVEVINQTGDPVEFNTSIYKLNNTKISVVNLQNGELLEERYSKIVEDNNLRIERPEYFEMKKTVLHSDEILKFKLNLRDYFEFNEQGRYKVTIEFDPFPGSANEHKIIISNFLFLMLKDRIVDEEYKELIKLLKESEEKKVYDPKGTIEFMLDSYQKKDWENYFLYQNLDMMILKYEQFKNNYLNASIPMKNKLIDDFKEWTINRNEMEIEKYEILEVNHSYKDKTCFVICRIVYKAPALYKNFIYKYQLHQNAIKWIVDDIDVITYSKQK